VTRCWARWWRPSPATTPEAFLESPGVGPKKLEAYGEAFLAVLAGERVARAIGVLAVASGVILVGRAALAFTGGSAG
jgi:hypothetical protein